MLGEARHVGGLEAVDLEGETELPQFPSCFLDEQHDVIHPDRLNPRGAVRRLLATREVGRRQDRSLRRRDPFTPLRPVSQVILPGIYPTLAIPVVEVFLHVQASCVPPSPLPYESIRPLTTT